MPGPPRILRVPADHPTIQSAVEAASPGDLVLLSAGEYREAVRIRRDSIVVRGVARDSVILNGEFTRDVGVRVEARGIAIEQLTIRNHVAAGILFLDARAFRVRAVAVSNSGAHGIVATATREGVIEDAYVSGASEAGVLIERCAPCRIVVRRVTGEHSAIGLLVRDAGGELVVVEGRWQRNRAGIVLLSTGSEQDQFQHGTVVSTNLISGNHSRTAPGSAATAFAWGNGVVVAGGRENRIAHNAFAFHAGHGILVAPIGVGRVAGFNNRIAANRFEKSGRGDVGLGGPRARQNCVEPAPMRPRSAPHFATCGSLVALIAAQDLVPVTMTAIRRWRVGAESYPDWKEQPLPVGLLSAPSLETWSLPQVEEFAMPLERLVLPSEADSLLAVARARQGPPIHVSAAGLRFAAVQAYLPVTPLGIAILLLAAAGGMVGQRRMVQSARAAALLRVGSWLAATTLLLSLALALVVAVLLSAI